MSRYILFLAKLKGRGRPFLKGARRGNNATLALFFIRPHYKSALQDREFYGKFVDRFQDISKVKNPSVGKAKV